MKVRAYIIQSSGGGLVDFKPLAMEVFEAVSSDDTFAHQFFLIKRALALAAADDANGMPYCIVMYAYWQKRVSTTMKKYNTKILYLLSFTARTRLPVGDEDLDLNAKKVLF